MCSKEEIAQLQLKSAIPVRSVGETAPGPAPGPAYWDSDWVERKVDGKIEKVAKWIFPNKGPSIHQQRRMIAKMVSIAVETAMSNHTYRFDGRVYKQEDGGPIGDELAQAVTRIVMTRSSMTCALNWG